MNLELTDQPAPADLDYLSSALGAYNDADAGPAERRPLAIFVRADAGAIIGGLSGFTAWGWLYTQWLWLAADLRGQGLAGRLLQMAEDEARRRNCHGAWIDTFNPVARRAYERQGYAVFGELDNFPTGRTRYFLRKSLL